MINIEICRGHCKETWNMRIGDIEGSIDLYNITKKQILEYISDEMDEKDEKGEK